MSRAFLGALLLAASGAWAEQAKDATPQRAEPVFTVYVFTAAGNDVKDVTEKWQKNLIEAAKKVREAASGNKDWFKVVESKDKAELVVEVTDIGYRKGRPGSKEQHLLEGTVIALGAEPVPVKAQAELAKDVPADMMERVARFCKANYTELSAKRTAWRGR